MIILRQKQKEFNVIQELYHSGGSRVLKKYMGRLQKGIGKQAEKMAMNQIPKNKKAQEAIKAINPDDKVTNKKLGKDLVKDAITKGNARVFDNNKLSKAYEKELGNSAADLTNDIDFTKRLGNFFIDEADNINDVSKKRLFKKVGKTLVPGKVTPRTSLVNLVDKYDDNVSALAHEIGHTLNSSGAAGNKKKAISRLNRMNKSKEKSKPGTTNRIKEEINQGNITLREEKNAWENGINLMKDHGATSEDIKKTKKLRKQALETYKTRRNFKVLDSISKRLEPKNELKEISLEDSIKLKRIDKNKLNLDQQKLKDKLEQKDLRQSRRKDKSTLDQLFGNSKKRK